MKNRKVIGFLSAVAMVFPMFTGNLDAYSESYAPRDINSHWAEKDITTLIHSDILKGSNSYAYPDSDITRGEFAALTARTLALQDEGTKQFGDIDKGHMFSGEINALASKGIVSGIGGGYFAPDRTITREEIMLILSRCTDSPSDKKISFKDIKSDYKYLTSLKKAVASGIISGFDDNTFRPYENATRGECASMLKRLLTSLEEADKNEVLALSEDFILNEIKNPSNNLELSIGRAKEETNLKIKAISEAQKNGTRTEKLLSGLKLREYKSEGSLASAIYDGRIDYVRTSAANTVNNSYIATYVIKTINKNDRLYVYDCTLSLSVPERINLTWEVYSAPPDYAPEGVNVVSPSSFQISAENLGVEKQPLFSGVSFYNSLTRKYMTYAKSNGYKVWPIYKTDFSLKTADRFLNDSGARMKAIEYLIKYSCHYGTDGLNIDFENIHERNRYLVTRHARELSVMLHELGIIVSADITRYEPTSANWSMCYDRDALSENCDYIMLMAYDEHYASSATPGSVASLDWTEDSIKRTLKEVPKEKLVLGIPFYMRYFELTGSKVTSSKAISMQTAYDLIQKNNPTYTYIEADKQYKISWKNGSKTCVFWLENTDTIQNRVQLANKYSLAGVASWRRGLEISKVWSVINDSL